MSARSSAGSPSFLLLPVLGQLTGALITGAVNAVVGGALVLGLFRQDLSRRARRLLLAANVGVLVLLASAAVLVDDFERAARQAMYGSDVRVALQTDVQEVLLTGGRDGRPLNLFLDGRLRVSGRDELRYHEALVHPAMNGPHARVLVLGGGDGLAVREVLRHRDVRRVDVVEIDAGVARLARTDAALSTLNAHALDDPRVRVRIADAFDWLRGAPRRRTTSSSRICHIPGSPRVRSCTRRSSTASPGGCWRRAGGSRCTGRGGVPAVRLLDGGLDTPCGGVPYRRVPGERTAGRVRRGTRPGRGGGHRARAPGLGVRAGRRPAGVRAAARPRRAGPAYAHRRVPRGGRPGGGTHPGRRAAAVHAAAPRYGG
ncbi:hypothetical protein SHKM778_02300 [Streptomyces sp. KM77-8]|uniref:PABS domain-containing protein n=1 Tax=Streptomyces haneummycinicus TaxID=3074435 RepID=A0AAT9H8Y1_9ACTN